jgi:transaldolase
MAQVSDLKVKIYADGADIQAIKNLAQNPLIKGFTTNPTLMRMAGVEDYEAFAQEVLQEITDRPVSFEVFADELDEMEKQGLKIASWGKNVNVKIPITNTKGVSTAPVIKSLSDAGVQLNVTAIMTLDQVRITADALNADVWSIVSVFAGRIADTGVDPVPMMKECKNLLKDRPKAELLWASPRELLNIFHANESGCGIITVTPDLLAKLKGVGKDLDQFSLETVEMFYRDATQAGYTIRT